MFFLFNLFLEARAEINIIGFFVETKTPKGNFEIK